MTELLGFLSENARRRMPDFSYLMPGDVCWRLPGSAPKQNLSLFYDDVGLAGYAWFEPGTDVEFDLRWSLDYDHPVVDAMLAWASSRRAEFPPAYPRFVDLDSMEAWRQEILTPHAELDNTDRVLTAIAFESDPPRIQRLTESGFAPTAHFQPFYRLELNRNFPDQQLAEGMSFRSVTEDDIDARVHLHRAAWVGSQFDRERYQSIRAMPSYQPSLDIVLETEAGFASYCICWEDQASGLGIFEPVGTHPEWRGKGVGKAIILEGLRRLRDRGLDHAEVHTAGFNAPAQALYESCGFVRKDTARTFMMIVV